MKDHYLHTTFCNKTYNIPSSDADPPKAARTSLVKVMGSGPTMPAPGVGGAERDEGGGDLVERGDELGVERGDA